MKKINRRDIKHILEITSETFNKKSHTTCPVQLMQANTKLLM